MSNNGSKQHRRIGICNAVQRLIRIVTQNKFLPKTRKNRKYLTDNILFLKVQSCPA